MTSWRRLLFVTLTALAAFSACSDERDYSESRLLDKLCAQGECTTSGSARQTQGLTADSIGFELGPAAGSVILPLRDDLLADFSSSSFSVEVLIQGLGRASSATLTPEYAWRSAEVSVATSGRPESATVTVSDGSTAKIADLRLVHSPDDLVCSVSAPGLRRRRQAAR
jgi:hypothetical protein